MNIELLVEDTIHSNIYDITDLVTEVSYNCQIQDYPGKLEITFIPTANVNFSEGARVRFKVNGQGIFFGYVFTFGQQETRTCTAYDQIRYLQNKDTASFANMTSAQIFAKICSEQQLQYKIVHSSSHIAPEKIYDNKSYYEMIMGGIEDTLINAGRWFMIRDNFGVLEHIEIANMVTDLVIGDSSLLNSYDYSTSIDDETANQVKLIHEYSEKDAYGNEDTSKPKKRDVYIARDSTKIAQWGLLQYFETVQDNLNEAQLKSRTDMLLKAKNKAKKTLKLSCLGDLRATAGASVFLDISDLSYANVTNKYAVISEVTHTFNNSKHTMELNMEVVI